MPIPRGYIGRQGRLAGLDALDAKALDGIAIQGSQVLTPAYEPIFDDASPVIASGSYTLDSVFDFATFRSFHLQFFSIVTGTANGNLTLRHRALGANVSTSATSHAMTSKGPAGALDLDSNFSTTPRISGSGAANALVGTGGNGAILDAKLSGFHDGSTGYYLWSYNLSYISDTPDTNSTHGTVRLIASDLVDGFQLDASGAAVITSIKRVTCFGSRFY